MPIYNDSMYKTPQPNQSHKLKNFDSAKVKSPVVNEFDTRTGSKAPNIGDYRLE